jgi:hypothetical protein
VTWPYYFDHWPVDTSVRGRIFAADYAVPVHAQAKTDAELMTRVSFAALATVDTAAPVGWTAVRVDTDEIGFIGPNQPMFPVLGHRLLLDYVDDRWRVVALVAGD